MSEVLPSPIELAAIDERSNVRRRYSITAACDLFGWVIVETSWGRIGSRGSSAVHSFSSNAEALAFIRRTLRKRATAPSRIGVPYSLQSPLPQLKHLQTWLEGFL